ncbi:putative protein OS=Kitasatospora aureofaciens OX=1894 GN=GCM10010502_12520 PE=4 SV=1 [Kitasatospora aureofaciens]|uniref:Uncharacterized protein n=1 Tax=Kitasatospora aureofaciens TaxID=1894 RepID=A0A8H9HFQ3_KITAU|nr:hypothetical protein [Kitasatospora aureofaciens]GGU63094.1 hypothetical protein GCM10010502_12520 [Kitasatospora aureofaciens]
MSWRRTGGYDLNVLAHRLGIKDSGEVDDRRPFLVYVMGPGIGDEELSLLVDWDLHRR